TPSLFAPETIARILRTVRQKFPLTAAAEISLEANPGTVSFETLAGYREAGINRLSFGAQSFNPTTLKTLGRIHTPEQVEAAFASAREAGITNLSLDLIFGVPGQTLTDLRSDLEAALNLSPVHLSAYSLTFEKGTPFYAAMKRGALTVTPDTEVAEMMELLCDFLPAHGLRRYEVSNFAWPGFEARHNLAYWNGDDYIGLGAGAHSFLRAPAASIPATAAGMRWSNYALPKKYIEAACAQGIAEGWRETLTPESAIFEVFFLGLRKIEGISLQRFEQTFAVSIEELYPGVLTSLCESGLASVTSERFALTERGLMLTDSVLEQFASPDSAAVAESVRLRQALELKAAAANG
ncbi:MAG: radical SAM family heme chaperone HemW, partial [Proteobacteria bacterium]|nr:radical SAM family heme chaperone HemW [Pseudomonadota bacterium]